MPQTCINYIPLFNRHYESCYGMIILSNNSNRPYKDGSTLLMLIYQERSQKSIAHFYYLYITHVNQI